MLLCANSPLIIRMESYKTAKKVDESIIEYARQSGKLVLDYQNPENYADACNEFYDQVWDATANEEE